MNDDRRDLRPHWFQDQYFPRIPLCDRVSRNGYRNTIVIESFHQVKYGFLEALDSNSNSNQQQRRLLLLLLKWLLNEDVNYVNVLWMLCLVRMMMCYLKEILRNRHDDGCDDNHVYFDDGTNQPVFEVVVLRDLKIN